jgi:DNA-directed RNA polymerase subunit beta'
MTDLKEGEEIIEPLEDRIIGRVAAEDVVDISTDTQLVSRGEVITEEIAVQIANAPIESVLVRTELTCEAKRGVCSLCYGRNLATGKLVGIGEAVGVMAAQSIGEPGTQLTLRTFHIGGTAARIAAESHIATKYDGQVKSESIRFITNAQKENVVLGRSGKMEILDDNNRVIATYNVPYGAVLRVKEGAAVKKGETLFDWDPYSSVILADRSGEVAFEDIIENMTYREELDEHTGLRQRVVIESKNKNLNPHIFIKDEKSQSKSKFIIPVKSFLQVQDKQKIQAGNVLVKIPREIGKTRDITGGLPRVAELFEARRPKEMAVVTEIDGVVKFGPVKRGVRELLVESDSEAKKYSVPYGKHILVHENDFVEAGDRLTDGSIAPQDILTIKGPGKVQEYLVNEIQEIYRLQGVKINDKHIGIIVRQMLQKVQILDGGDSMFLEGDSVDRATFLEENEKILEKVVVADPGDSLFREGDLTDKKTIELINRDLKKDKKKPIKYRKAKPASFTPVLLGITQAALNTESFISAASFQETTKVLTEAAVSGKEDELIGLKENVIMGHLIPAGTGLAKYANLYVEHEEKPVEEEEEILSEEVGNITETS